MRPTTPKNGDSAQNPTVDSADFTRPQQPETPSNFNKRLLKRNKHSPAYSVPEPALQYGDKAHISTSASGALCDKLDEVERKGRIRHDVIRKLAHTIDGFINNFANQPEHISYAHEVCDSVVKYLTTGHFAATHEQAALRVFSPPASSATDSSGKGVTYAAKVSAGIPKTLTKSGAGPVAPKSRASSVSGKASSGSIPDVITNATRVKEDRRVLVTIETEARLKRAEPYVLRQELCHRIEGLTLSSIPSITITKTGWAIHPVSLTVRDLLLTQENKEMILRVTKGVSVRTPEEWHNYAVPGCPTTVTSLGGGLVDTAKHIREEILAQTGQNPIDVRPSRHGVNVRTGKITYVVSFLKPVRAFRLFNSSEAARYITKRAVIARHDPGCQGYCNRHKCTRYARCALCSTRLDQHQGPSGANCTNNPRCANCHGPFPADHQGCPAMPRTVSGKIIKPTKKELDVVRRHGDRVFRAAHEKSADTAVTQSTPNNDKSQGTPQTTTNTQVQEQGSASVPNPKSHLGKRKPRGEAVTAHEKAGLANSQHAPTIQVSSTLPSSSITPVSVSPSPSDVGALLQSSATVVPDTQHDVPSSSRPGRNKSLRASLNVDQMMAAQLNRYDVLNDMDVDMAEYNDSN